MTLTPWLVHHGFARRQHELEILTEQVAGSRFYESQANVKSLSRIFRLGKKLDKWTALVKSELKGE